MSTLRGPAQLADLQGALCVPTFNFTTTTTTTTITNNTTITRLPHYYYCCYYHSLLLLLLLILLLLLRFVTFLIKYKTWFRIYIHNKHCVRSLLVCSCGDGLFSVDGWVDGAFTIYSPLRVLFVCLLLWHGSFVVDERVVCLIFIIGLCAFGRRW